MNKDIFTIIPYETADGKVPFREFLLDLEPKLRAKVLRGVDLLEQHGNTLKKPLSDYLRDDILELRIKQGSNISRVLYFFVFGRKIIITHGFVKKGNKTPPGEIELALKYKADWEKRNKNDL